MLAVSSLPWLECLRVLLSRGGHLLLGQPSVWHHVVVLALHSDAIQLLLHVEPCPWPQSLSPLTCEKLLDPLWAYVCPQSAGGWELVGASPSRPHLGYTGSGQRTSWKGSGEEMGPSGCPSFPAAFLFLFTLASLEILSSNKVLALKLFFF